MAKKDIILGFLLGLVATVIGTFLFIELGTEHHFFEGIIKMKSNGFLNKLIALGAICNLPLFYFFIRKEQDNRAKGILIQVVVLTVIMLFI